MAKTLLDAQTETRIYLDEATALDFLDSEVTMAINRSYHKTVQKVMEVYDAWYDAVTQFTYAVVANQQEYTVDPSIIKVTRVEINYNPLVSNSTATRALPIKQDEVRGNLGNTSGSGSYMSAGYYIYGQIGVQKIGFLPVPTIADTTGKSITVWATALPVDLVSPTDQLLLPWADNFIQIVAKGAAAQLLRKGQQETAEALRLKAEVTNDLIDMQTFLKDRQSDSGQFIEDSMGEAIDFSTTPIV